MDKLKMQTPDLTDKNIEQIAQLFPNVITETRDENGVVKKAVDFDLLKQALSKTLVEDDNERYRLDWPGEKASLLKANIPITKTLRPCREESVNFDTTENLYIEGDNFEVLKILQESYLGKVKMIYIDPPYNTGNDFIYKDDFKKSKEEYEEELGTTDEEGGKLFRNTDSNGRFHSDWLSMMYERLIVARDLLKDDGVIFISIDDGEQDNLKKICDEIYGEGNLLNTICLENDSRARPYGSLATTHEYILVYSKYQDFIYEILEDTEKEFNDKDDKGGFDLYELRNRNITFNVENRPNLYYPFYVNPNNMDENKLFEISLVNKQGWVEVYPQESQGIKTVWRWGKEKAANNLNTVLFAKEAKNEAGYQIVKKYRAVTYTLNTIWNDKEIKTDRGTLETKALFDNKKYFDFPKPVDLIKRLLKISTKSDSVILDFFSGSATTAHAVMQLNAEELMEEFATKNTKKHENEGNADSEKFRDLSCVSWQKKGKRKFIMVQLPEKTDENSEAYKAGYKTIAEIGKERIRRAGKKILEELATKNTKKHEKEEGKSQKSLFSENKEETFSDLSCLSWQKNLDIGFRVYKTADTNMKDVFYHPAKLKQEELFKLESNIKEDRTPEDLLTQVILDLGLELSLPVETKKMLENTVFIVQTNALVACFDNDIDFKIVDSIAALKPFKVVFKDASFKDDKDRINVEERFKRLSPETKVTVI